MARIPTILAVSLTAALALTGCGAAAASGTTLVYGVNGEPDNLDPHASPLDVTGLFTRPVLDSLVSLDIHGGIHPWLATSWDISPDGRTYTFKLRHDVKFSDGTVFDAAAVKANLDHVVAPTTKSQLAAAQILPYTGTAVVDPYTAKVTLSQPLSPFLAALATAYLGIESPAALAKGPDFLAKNVIGSGPFVIDQFTPHQDITYHRNPAYNWAPEGAGHTGPAHLDRLQFKILTTDSVRLGALTSGQVDAIASVPPASVDLVKRNPDLKLDTRQAPGGNYNYFPNVTAGVFTDVRVRKAFRDGIDFHTAVDKLYFGTFQPASSPIAPSTPGYDRDTETQWKYDPRAAGRLLDEAGWNSRDSAGYRTKNGQRLTVRWPVIPTMDREQRATLAEQVQAGAKQLGFDVQLVNSTLNEYVSRYGKGDYDLLDFSWQRADGDALRNLFDTSNITDGTRLSQNGARFSDQEVDGWLASALRTTDLSERAGLYAKVQHKVTDQAVVFPVYVFNYVLGESKRVTGISWEPQAYPTFYDASVTAK